MKECVICNCPTTKLLYNLKFKIYKCKNCGFQFCTDAKFDSSLSSDLNEESREKALLNLRKYNFLEIVKKIKKHKSDNFKGLEIGVGHGWFLEVCRDNNIACDGIEPEVRFSEKYKESGVNVIHGFYPDGISNSMKYDFIIFNDVLEHLPNLQEIMKANYTILNPNGLLIVNLPIQEGIIYFFARVAYYLGIKSLLNRMWQFDFHSPHLSYFRKQNLIDFSLNNNFQLEESFKLKTINLDEISQRINQDKKQLPFKRFLISIGVYLFFPFFRIFPDTYCFIFKKK